MPSKFWFPGTSEPVTLFTLVPHETAIGSPCTDDAHAGAWHDLRCWSNESKLQRLERLRGLGLLNRLLAVVLLATGLVGCEKDEPAQSPILRLCSVVWQGTLTTDSNAFNVRACWNGRCTSNMPVRSAQKDGGTAPPYRDAGCFPTTPGGLPSGCELVPMTPGPGCGVGEIGAYFSVSACAEADREQTTFLVGLTPATEGYPDDGDRVALTIETEAGVLVAEATATLGSNDRSTDSSCRSGRLGLDGTAIE